MIFICNTNKGNHLGYYKDEIIETIEEGKNDKGIEWYKCKYILNPHNSDNEIIFKSDIKLYYEEFLDQKYNIAEMDEQTYNYIVNKIPNLGEAKRI